MKTKQNRYFSHLSAWSLAFGCAVGWGTFVMPGTSFLPIAGPLGTTIGMILGAVAMLIIAKNYHTLMNSDETETNSGGTYTFTKNIFGYDHGFLCAWFLSLTYIAIVWANLTALALIVRNIFGSLFQFGFHYEIAGFTIYAGEVLFEIAVLFLFLTICAKAKNVAFLIQSVLAVALILGIVCCVFLTFGDFDVSPSFSPYSSKKNPFMQIISIAALSPWAFVGFESISHTSKELNISNKNIGIIIAFAIILGLFAYIALTFVAISTNGGEFSSWEEYISSLKKIDGTRGFPVFYAVQTKAGKIGFLILVISVFSGIITGIIGNTIATSRLLSAMADDGILPKWFSLKEKNGNPKNAVIFIALCSFVIPFLGRTAIGWIVDVTTIGAAIAYAYTSAVALKFAKQNKNLINLVFGAAGIIIAAFFCLFLLMPSLWSVGALSSESYLILAFWSVAGFLYFRQVFLRDKKRLFGKSTIVWISLLFLIFLTSIMWMRQATHAKTNEILENISSYYAEEMEKQGINMSDSQLQAEENFLSQKMDVIRNELLANSFVQLVLILIALGVMFSVYSGMRKRERELEEEREREKRANIAKTAFLSNMSHDIRTPMNAIIGYTTLAQKENVSIEQMRDFLSKIDSSSKHLLALINDVLEMSRIESGKMDLEEEECDIRRVMEELRDMFATQMSTKGIIYTVEYGGIRNPIVLCDKHRLNRVLLNLVNNAFKFTSEGGFVSVSISEVKTDKEKGFAEFELRVKDNGIGMSKEFAAKVFEEFEREQTSTVSKIQGTGLGMAITKSILDLMGGEIRVNTEKGVGTEFVINIPFKLQEKLDANTTEENAISVENLSEDANVAESSTTTDFSKMTLLLVDDMDVNREIAVMLLSEIGFSVETAENGKIAVEKIEQNEANHFAAVLMDIQMPVMDGYEATRKIRALSDKKKSTIPIIAMTANAFSEDVKKSQEAGMNAHVAKPIDVDKFMQTLKDCIK